MNKWSKNNKLNKLLSGIEEDLLELSLEELKRYYNDFKSEADFNLAQYGNLIVYYYDLRQFYIDCGYSANTINRMSDEELWNTYKRQVGFVTRNIIKTM